jgi:putative ABC transport system permease protein
MLACFATVYDHAKGADARFLVGSDLRVTPNPTSGAPHPVSLVDELGVAGTSGATAVVFSPDNSVLTSPFNEDVATLAAIDPVTYSRVAALQDSLFIRGGSATSMMSKLRTQPRGVLVNVALADGLKLKAGDKATVLFGRGTDQQTRRAVTVLGLFTHFPGAPKGTDIVANLGYYGQVTGLTEADYYLLSTTDRSGSGLVRAHDSLKDIKGFSSRFTVQTSATALDRDQSSLTALNVRGLLDLDSFFIFCMSAAATAMFVFGLLLHRRREYITMRAQGMRRREIRLLILAESGITTTLGAAIGVLVGIAMASQFVHVLRPIFTLPPPLEVPPAELGLLVALVLGAGVLSSVAAALLIGRLKPTELLREE